MWKKQKWIWCSQVAKMRFFLQEIWVGKKSIYNSAIIWPNHWRMSFLDFFTLPCTVWHTPSAPLISSCTYTFPALLCPNCQEGSASKDLGRMREGQQAVALSWLLYQFYLEWGQVAKKIKSLGQKEAGTQTKTTSLPEGQWN